MAKTSIYVFNGSISPPTGFSLDFQTMRISSSQGKENITSYQGTTFGIYLGSGTEMVDVAVTGYPYKGVTAAQPFIGSMNGTVGAIGSAAVFTVDTACTVSMRVSGDGAAMDHSRLIAGAKCSMSFFPTADITVAWATS